MKNPEFEIKDEYDADELWAEFELVFKVFDISDPKNPTEKIYDEIGIALGLDARLIGDYVFARISTLRLNVHVDYGQQSLPKRNPMDLSESEYRQFLNDFALFLGTVKQYLNDVHLTHGVLNPFREYLQDLQPAVWFKKNHMYLFFVPKGDEPPSFIKDLNAHF